jgi:hypothetical protein
MLIDCEASGRLVIAETKLWSQYAATPIIPTAAQISQWNRFSLGTFLLGIATTNSKCYFSFRPDKDTDKRAGLLWADINLGAATTTYAKIGGVYQRSFVNGKVLVNPTNSAVNSIALGGSYRTSNGTTVTSLNLPAHDAEVLIQV